MSYLINPYRYASAGGACTTPAASYTGLAISQQSITWPVSQACYRKPILTATSVSHSLADDTNLRFWVNCKFGDNTSSTFGAAACSSGSDLVAGMLFTYSQLQAGIDLIAFDSVNAAAQDAAGDVVIGWDVRCTAVDISDCSTSICADGGTNLFQYESIPYDGPALYTDGSGTYPQFSNGPTGDVLVEDGAVETYALILTQSLLYWEDAYSFGEDSFGATDFKIQIQYDTGCDTSGGCGSYNWTNADDNNNYFDEGSGGAGSEQGFTVTEAECWDQDYIFVRYRVVAVGTCNNVQADAWSSAIEVDLMSAGGQCNGGGP
jgi:hypothetical protein